MKKPFHFFCWIFALLLSVSAAAAGEALLQTGDIIAGFRVYALDRIDYMDTDVIYLEHEKSGAQLVYLANDDLERSFSVGFRTNADTDQGLPHVFEHSTLSGSVKYPDPNLVFSMLSQTYNTFINAFTYPTMTLYPCASLSEDQLYRFVDYYMTGVTEPLLLTDERAMKREAYRYVLEDAQSDLTVNGVVYNEMQGALSAPSSMMYTHLAKLLYPGSVRANESGGLPEEILTIEWQQLKDFHAYYYHPSNALLTLYGDLDLERFLRLLDEEYLCKYDRKEIIIADDNYTPYEGHREQTFSFPVSADASADGASYLCYGIAMNGCTPEDRVLASVVASAMNLESSVFKQLMQERLPGAYANVDMVAYTPVPTMVFTAMYADPEDKDTFRQIAEESIAALAESGISSNIYKMLINSIKVQQLLTSEDSNIGINMGANLTEAWSYTGQTDAAIRELDVTFAIDSYAQSGAIDGIITRYLLNPSQTALSITQPVPGLREEQDAAFAASLARKKADMSDEEIEALIAETADFNAWTEANNQTSLIGEIKVVDVQTLPEEVQTAAASDVTADGLRHVTSIVEEEGMVMPALYFDSSVIPAERLHDYALYTSLLGVLDTAEHTREELQEKLSIAFSSLSASASTLSYEEGGYHPYFAVSWTALSENLEESYALLRSILFNTDFSDISYIRSYLSQALSNARENYASNSAHTLALSIGEAALLDAYLYSYRVSELDYLEYLESVCAMSDEELLALMEGMAEIRDLLMNRNGLIIRCVGSEEIVQKNDALASAFAAQLDDTAHERYDYTDLLEPLPDSIAVIIEGTVQYNLLIAAMEEGTEMDGRFTAMGLLTQDRLLTPFLRFENGAYGAFSDIDDEIVYALSYRDPNYASTYDYYQQLGDALRALPLTQADVDGYITTAYSSLAMPMGPYALGKSATSRALRGSEDDMLQRMQQLKSFTAEDVQALSAVYDRLAQEGVRVTVGSRSVIEANADDFDLIITTLADEAQEETMLPAA